MASKHWSCSLCETQNDQARSICKWCDGPKPSSDTRSRQRKSRGAFNVSRRNLDYDEPDINTTTLQHDETNDIRIVLLGKTGSGKSATGNTILGTKHFHSEISGSSVTSKCSRKSAKRFGKTIHIVDTPGIFDTSTPDNIVQKEISKCIGLTAPGPHAFLLVLTFSRFTKEEQEAVKHFTENFGHNVMKHMIILFTRKDDLLADGKTLDGYLGSVPDNLAELVRDCGHRCIAFNNRASGQEGDDQAKQLLRMIDSNIQQNNGMYYTDEMYQKAENAMKERETEIAREREEEKMRERREIEKEVQEKYRGKLTSHNIDVEETEMRIAELESTLEYHTFRESSLTNEISQVKNKIEAEKREKGTASRKLYTKLSTLEDELSTLKLEKDTTSMKLEIELFRETLKEKKRDARRIRQERNKLRDELLQKQEERLKKLESTREKARNEVEQESGGILGSIFSGIACVGKTIWKSITSWF